MLPQTEIHYFRVGGCVYIIFSANSKCDSFLTVDCFR